MVAVPAGVTVIEAPRPEQVPSSPAAGNEQSTYVPLRKRQRRNARAGPTTGQQQGRRSYRQLAEAAWKEAGEAGAALQADDEEIAALEKVPECFAESYLAFPGPSRVPLPALMEAAAKGAPEGVPPVPAVTSQDVDMKAWYTRMHDFFNLFVCGVGSKYAVLEAFGQQLRKNGKVVVLAGFSPIFVLSEALRGVLEQLYPDAKIDGSSVDSIATSLRLAKLAEGPHKRLFFIVHNLECLPEAHQAILAGLAATPGIRFAVSVDSLWAPLMLPSDTLAKFNFSREEVHTFAPYQVETAARRPNSRPAYSDPVNRMQQSSKASLGLVLKSLTVRHRELVQAIAEEQLENGGKTGLTFVKLLEVTTDRMIASTASKLRSLLNELKDHEVIVWKNAQDGGTVVHLNYSTRVLERLADGEEPDAESDDENNEAAE
mmetsp:Transcript_83078/g.173909  ORF Transcript_83078/g.173909 Transcript_83078/m.173909 type:complete len:430 (+) Transcript_83078:130-1419(+)